MGPRSRWAGLRVRQVDGGDRVGAGRQVDLEAAGAAGEDRSRVSFACRRRGSSGWRRSRVWLAATMVTSSGLSVLIGGCGIALRSAGSAGVGSGPIADLPAAARSPASGLIVTLIRVETLGRCSLGWSRIRRSPRPARSRRSAPATAAALALPRPIAGLNLAEGQVDDLGRNAIFTYGELGAGLGLAAQDRQADRPQGGGDGRCRRAGRPPSRPARSAVAGPRRGAQPQASQVAVGLALVVEAGDRLLADVAALGEADRAARRCRPRPASSRFPSRRRSGGGRPRCGGSRPPRRRRRPRRRRAARRATRSASPAATIRSMPSAVPTARHCDAGDRGLFAGVLRQGGGAGELDRCAARSARAARARR